MYTPVDLRLGRVVGHEDQVVDEEVVEGEHVLQQVALD